MFPPAPLTQSPYWNSKYDANENVFDIKSESIQVLNNKENGNYGDFLKKYSTAITN